MKFSKKKFTGFNAQKQIKIILDMCELLQQIWEDEKQRKRQLTELYNCVSWLPPQLLPQFQNLDSTFNSLQDFWLVSVPILQKYQREPRDHDFLIYRKDNKKASDTIPIHLVLDNLRSAFNVGSIFRAAECFGIHQILLCGYTATPDNAKVKKTAMGTEKIIKWTYFEQTSAAIAFMKKQKIPIYALETVEGATEIDKFSPAKSFALILGNEALGIFPDHLKQADEILSIPLRGWKNSLNVGVSSSIALYELTKNFIS
jgi:tRNA G18 (ribose-2'-O)-methylase SpoU